MIDSSSVLAISGPGVLPWARETMVALDEARRVASYGMKLLDHKHAAQRPLVTPQRRAKRHHTNKLERQPTLSVGCN